MEVSGYLCTLTSAGLVGKEPSRNIYVPTICSVGAQNPRSPLPRNINSWRRPGAQLCLKEGDHAVIKISAIDTSSITTEAQLYDELIESGAWAVPLVAYSECGGETRIQKISLDLYGKK